MLGRGAMMDDDELILVRGGLAGGKWPAGSKTRNAAILPHSSHSGGSGEGIAVGSPVHFKLRVRR